MIEIRESSVTGKRVYREEWSRPVSPTDVAWIAGTEEERPREREDGP
jgi:hypothetical protein